MWLYICVLLLNRDRKIPLTGYVSYVGGQGGCPHLPRSKQNMVEMLGKL